MHVHASIGKFRTENLAFSSIWFFENTAFSAIQYMRFDVRFFGHCIKKYVKDSPCYRQVYHTAASFPCTCMQILELYVEGTYDKNLHIISCDVNTAYKSTSRSDIGFTYNPTFTSTVHFNICQKWLQ